MTFHFAPAVRDRVSVLVALAGASGSGKTFSALRLAKGMSPAGKIAFIDTEARRGLHYADQFSFLHTDMRAPFRPEIFIEAIRAAENTGAEVVIIDNFSDEYEGEGGICEWAEDIEASGTKSPGNWKIPKGAHKKMMGALLQFRVSVIFCLRADEKIKIARENNKTVVVPMGWMPICEKRFMYNMTMSFTLTPDAPGRPHFDLPHKLQHQHRSMFSDKNPISEETGRALAAWARGDQSPSASLSPAQLPVPSDPGQAAEGAGSLSVEAMAREAAMRGREVLRTFYRASSPANRKLLDALKGELEALIPAEAD
jgi:hypothetical protein